ncbi:MAG: hypothetical protein IJ298_11525 [Ruminococcus sp.]|nr:hypothetical protein [Ruminococcus sp.]
MAQWTSGRRPTAPSAGSCTPFCFLDAAGQRFSQMGNLQKTESLSSSPDEPGILYRISCMRLQALTIGDEQIEEGDLMSSADFCVCCGATVPEGRQTCLECEKAASKKESLYDDVCRALTDYEHASDPETPKQNFTEVFYHLLVRVSLELQTS